MAREHVVETRRDRIDLAHDAGFSALSPGSVLSGVLVAYGAFAVLAAIAGGVLTAMGVDSTNDLSGDFREVGVGTGIALAFVMFVSYLWGGYVAGRMARRAGAINGLFVFVFGLLIAAGIGAAIGMQAGTDTITDNLRSIGVPTSGDEWRGIGTLAGVAALAAMLLGSIVGGTRGERWHGRLVTRALDPTVGPDVDLRDRLVDEEHTAVQNRPMVAAGAGAATGAHFAGTDSNDATTLDDDLHNRRR